MRRLRLAVAPARRYNATQNSVCSAAAATKTTTTTNTTPGSSNISSSSFIRASHDRSPLVNTPWRTLGSVGIVLFAGIVFLIDLLTPLGVEVWVLYLPVILAPVWFTNTRQVAVTAGACTVLVVVGSFLSPPALPPWSDVLNRGMGLLAIWLTAFAGMTITRNSMRLGQALTNWQREAIQHQQAREALARSEERMRLAVQVAGIGTWDLDLRTGKAMWSDGHFRMLGYEPTCGEVSPAMWTALVHPDD